MAYHNPNFKRSIIRKDLVTNVMAIDCEMVSALKGDGTLNRRGNPACWNPAGRCSVTNSDGQVVLDCRMYHPQSVKIVSTNKRWSGLTWADLESQNGAESFDQVRTWVIEIFQDRTMVGHNIKCDLKAMDLVNELRVNKIRTADTQRLFNSIPVPDGEIRKSGLCDLARQYLGRDIQSAAHDSIEDARATMDLYDYYNENLAPKEEEEAEADAAADAANPQANSAHPNETGKGKEREKVPDPRPDEDGFYEVHSNRERKWMRKHQTAQNKAKAALESGARIDSGWYDAHEAPWERAEKQREEKKARDKENE